MIALHQCLDRFEGLLFLTTNRVGSFDETFMIRMTLAVLCEGLDQVKRRIIWDNLQEELVHERNHQIRLSASAKKFLDTDEIHNIDWTSHEIVNCFRTATALAESKARKFPDWEEGKEIIIEVEHLKEVLNMAYSFRAYIHSTHGQDFSRAARAAPGQTPNATHGHLRRYGPPPPPRPPSPTAPPFLSLPRGGVVQAMGQGSAVKPLKSNQPPITVDSDTDVCISDLNRVEWEQFRAAGSGGLFRNSKFYAIDMLLGEPLVKLKVLNMDRKIPKPMTQTGVLKDTQHNSKNQERQAEDPLPSYQSFLPERIRINSPAIANAFRYIHRERSLSDFRVPFLIFRPFRSLVYYEPEFREWVARQEAILQGRYHNCYCCT